jgi:hypothetical protein
MPQPEADRDGDRDGAQAAANAATFWLTTALAAAWSTRTLSGIVAGSDIHTISEGVPSEPHRGDALSGWDRSAYVRVDRAFLAEVAMPMACGGVFYIANFSLTYVAVAALALLTGIANYATAESAVVMTGFDTIRINDAIARWVDHPVEKPSISVMSGFLKQWCGPTGGMTLKYVKAAFLLFDGAFPFLVRVAVANAILFLSVSMLLAAVSRVLNAKRFARRRRRARVGLYLRHVKGRTYVRRSVLMSLAACLPTLSIAAAALLPRFQ